MFAKYTLLCLLSLAKPTVSLFLLCKKLLKLKKLKQEYKKTKAVKPTHAITPTLEPGKFITIFNDPRNQIANY